MTTFEKYLTVGKIAESKIAGWLRERGNTVLPVYEVELAKGKGPQLFLPTEELIAPDLFVFNFEDGGKACWIESKHKTVFSWHRITERWVTGIDLRHYKDYLTVDELTPWPVWLLFLHQEDSTPRRDERWPCPTGLFGERISVLRECENHRCEPRDNETGWGQSGMVYWAHKDLKKLASLDELTNAIAADQDNGRIQRQRNRQ